MLTFPLTPLSTATPFLLIILRPSKISFISWGRLVDPGQMVVRGVDQVQKEFFLRPPHPHRTLRNLEYPGIVERALERRVHVRLAAPLGWLYISEVASIHPKKGCEPLHPLT